MAKGGSGCRWDIKGLINMVDIHSHLIHAVDDGPSCIKDSLRMLLEAEKCGIKAIIATPHLRGNMYDPEKAAENLEELRHRTRDCGVELYLGYEVHVNESLADDVKSERSITLNGSDYLLLELPFEEVPLYSYETIYRLNLNNITPVIAHPERNRSFVRSFDKFIGVVEKGCLLQLDAASIIGVYGTEVKRFTKKLIKMNMVDFVASDAHSAEDYYEWYLEAYRKVSKWGGTEYANDVFARNPEMLLNNSADFLLSKRNADKQY